MRSPSIMRIITSSVAMLFAAHCFASSCNSMPAELDAMAAADQALRHRLMASAPASTVHRRDLDRLELVDRVNTDKLKRILAACGWPKKSVYGESAGGKVWLLVQHADQDRAFQMDAIELLADAVRAGEASGVHLAYLSDRVTIAQNRPQLYGTQFKVVGECGLELLPVDDMAKVEDRRKQLGMPTVTEYRQQVLHHAMPTNCAQTSK